MLCLGYDRNTSKTTTTRIDGTAAFISHSFRALFITETEVEKSVVYGRSNTRIVEGKKV